MRRAPTLDGLGKYYRGAVEESPAEPVDVAEALRAAAGPSAYFTKSPPVQYRDREACEMVEEFARGE